MTASLLPAPLQVYIQRGEYSQAYTITCYLRATRPGDLGVLRDGGIYLYHLGRIPGGLTRGSATRGARGHRLCGHRCFPMQAVHPCC